MDIKTIYSSHTGSEMHKEMQVILEKLPSIRNFEKNEIIYHQGDLANTFYFLKKGKVNVFMTSLDGMEKTVNTATSGELLGEGAFFDKKPRVSSARAVVNSELVLVDENLLLELIKKCPKLAFELLEILAKRIRLLSSQLDSMTFMQADERIAQLLLKNAVDNTVKLTHEEISNSVGVSRVTVSKTLSKFVAENLVETQYGCVVIKNKEKLFVKANM